MKSRLLAGALIRVAHYIQDMRGKICHHRSRNRLREPRVALRRYLMLGSGRRSSNRQSPSSKETQPWRNSTAPLGGGGGSSLVLAGLWGSRCSNIYANRAECRARII